MTIANCSLSMIIGELSARTFCFVKSRCERSNLKDKYSIGDFFSKSEKAAIMAIAPLSAAYLLVYKKTSLLLLFFNPLIIFSHIVTVAASSSFHSLLSISCTEATQ